MKRAKMIEENFADHNGDHDDADQTDNVQPEIADAVSLRKISKVRQGQKLDRPNDDKPAPKKRKASENDRNPRREKRNAPAKATGAKSLPKRKG